MEVGLDGLLKREQDLKARGLAAVVEASKPVLETWPEVFRRLADAGQAIIGGYPGVFWDVPYDDHSAALEAVKSQIEELTGQPMQVVSCTYFSHDENTVRAADALGVPDVLARGTEDVRALVYRPEDYDLDLIEVLNLELPRWAGARSATSASTPARHRGGLRASLRGERR